MDLVTAISLLAAALNLWRFVVDGHPGYAGAALACAVAAAFSWRR